MKKLKTLFIQFENHLKEEEVSAFRGAIIEKVGRENLLFHQHLSDSQVLYKYPLIQYKSLKQKPSIFCLGEGADEMHKLFQFKDWDLNLNGKRYALKIERLDLNTITLNVWNRTFLYNLKNWIALNSKNYKTFQSLTTLTEKVQFLEKNLTGNILSFAKGVDWRIDNEVTVAITDVQRQRRAKYKGVPLITFDVQFKSNVFLPNHLGLGKSVSHGFGQIRMISKNQD